MAKQGFGVKFQLSAIAIVGTAGALTEVISSTFPDPSTGTTETTHHQSPGGIKEYLPDLIDLDPVSVIMNLVPGSTTDTTCATAATSRAIYFFLLTVPAAGATTWAYSGQCIVTGYKGGAVGVSGKMEATVTLKTTGAVTRALGS